MRAFVCGISISGALNDGDGRIEREEGRGSCDENVTHGEIGEVAPILLWQVHFAAFAPPVAAIGNAVPISLWLHLRRERDAMAETATSDDDSGALSLDNIQVRSKTHNSIPSTHTPSYQYVRRFGSWISDSGYLTPLISSSSRALPL